MYKIIGADGKEYGPVTADQLRQWIAEGRVNALTKVLLEGTTEWKPLSAFPEFAAAASVTPPLTPGYAIRATVASDEVNAPAIALMITAILGFLAQVTLLMLRLLSVSVMATQPGTPPWLLPLAGTLGIATSGLGILMSIFIFIGALRMKNLANYGLVMAASILAMIPCYFPCCCLGLPIGIWALVVLSKPEVKSAFH